MTLLIIIVNYRTAELVIDCLRSLASQVPSLDGASAVIVDNASGDDSPDRIEQAVVEHGWGDWVQVVRSPVNAGFSAGNNVGLAHADADAYLLLNSDTLVRPGALKSLLEAMEANDRAGLIGPRLEWPDATPQNSCFRYFTPLTELTMAAETGLISRLLARHDISAAVDPTSPDIPWVSFACVLIRRSVIQEVGPLDEGYFMYFDDTDYCRQARAAGWQVQHCAKARVVHLRGGSSPVKALAAARRRRPAYFFASRARYYAKFYGRSGLWAANLAWYAGRLISLARERIGHKAPHICDHEGRDIWIGAWRPLENRRNPV